MIKLNQDYIHYKNKKTYTTKGFCKIQENDLWVDAVFYLPIDSPELFVRSVKEFEAKFILT